MNRFNLLFILLFLSFNSFAQHKDVWVVLLSGQSNMVGYGNYEDLDNSVKKRIKKVAKRVFLSTSEKEPKPLSYYIYEGEKFNFNAHFGPELCIGLTLAEAYPNQEFLLIKKAVGGTSLYGAWSTNWTAEKADFSERGVRKEQKLFQAHLQLIDFNLKRLTSERKPYKIYGLVWMQGESDTNKEITASAYKTNLENLITGYRNYLNLEKMPVVIGQVNPLPRKFKEGPEIVRNAMVEVANSDATIEIVKTSTEIDWKDFPKHADNLHYNTEGQKRLGTSFSEKLIELNQ
ncbi:sialate O-acetylesterase [Formosa sp. PL04]|uniref:sialate O-acetylesterase n=1 Tax=Formosa sp. PL04 TaxID=3081755 RepID=UPI0029810F7E|nr:sialate O-acetylesterase [Formosa sp. PL04]MDW5288093.1 sialate O-acetylesterase [Formosa sp. PL04]